MNALFETWHDYYAKKKLNPWQKQIPVCCNWYLIVYLWSTLQWNKSFPIPYFTSQTTLIREHSSQNCMSCWLGKRWNFAFNIMILCYGLSLNFIWKSYPANESLSCVWLRVFLSKVPYLSWKFTKFDRKWPQFYVFWLNIKY